DMTLLLLFALGAFLGMRRGLIWQVARLVAFGLAIYACIVYHEHVAEWLAPYMSEQPPLFHKFLAYAVTFLGVVLALFLLTLLVERFVKAVRLKPVDRVLGGVLGLIKAGLLGGTLIMGGALYGGEQFKEAIADSKIAPYLVQFMGEIIVAIPQHLKEQFEEALQRIKAMAAEKVAERRGSSTYPTTRHDS